MRDDDRRMIWLAQLAEMPIEVIISFLEQQRWAYPREHRKPALCGWCVPDLDTRRDRLPPGYPPLAEDDLPFEVE